MSESIAIVSLVFLVLSLCEDITVKNNNKARKMTMKKIIGVIVTLVLILGAVWFFSEKDEAHATILEIYEAVEANDYDKINDYFLHSDTFVNASTTEIVNELASILQTTGGIKASDLTSYTFEELNETFRQRYNIVGDMKVVFQALSDTDNPTGYAWVLERYDNQYYPLAVEASRLSDLLAKESDDTTAIDESEDYVAEQPMKEDEQDKEDNKNREDLRLNKQDLLGHWTLNGDGVAALYITAVDNQRLALELVGTDTDWLRQGERTYLEAEGDIVGQKINFITNTGIEGVLTYEKDTLSIESDAVDMHLVTGTYAFVREMLEEPVIKIKDDYFHFYDISYLDDVASVKEKLNAETYIDDTEYAPYLRSDQYNYFGEIYGDKIYSYGLDVPTEALEYFIQTMSLDLYTDGTSYYIVNDQISELIKFQAFNETFETVGLQIMAADENFYYWVDEGSTYKIN